MAKKFKRGRFSEEELSVIKSSPLSAEQLSDVLNRSVKSIESILNKTNELPKQPVLEKQIPDAPPDLPKGYAKKFFEIEDSKNPGKKRKGIAILTEGGSEAGDEFLKADKEGLLPMSSKHRNCIAKASL